MRNDFAAFILTHGRPDHVYTFRALRSHGYTGRLYLVVDDEDPTLEQYRAEFGDDVLTFSKADIAERFDEGDNFRDRRSIFYARNACWDLARQVGVRYFAQFDDDYTAFSFRFDGEGRTGTWRLDRMDWLLDRLCGFLTETPFASVAIAQGGDFIGGAPDKIASKRKAMNSFVCDTAKPFEFVGRVNEDVNTYTCEQRRGVSFLTFMAVQLVQRATQRTAGGMTDLYLDGGTYLKSFYAVMYAPSAVKIGTITDYAHGGKGTRIHHAINWNAAAPLIVREEHRKARGNA